MTGNSFYSFSPKYSYDCDLYYQKSRNEIINENNMQNDCDLYYEKREKGETRTICKTEFTGWNV